MPHLEDVFRQIWESSLRGRSSVDAADDFFEAGGDSLAAAEFVAGLGQHLGVVVEPCWLYDHPRLPEALDVVRSMIADVEPNARTHSVGPVGLGLHARGSIHPLSFQQQGLLAVLDRVRTAHSYQVTYAVAVPTAIDVRKLQEALSATSLRHAALRTSIRESTQRIDHEPLNLERISAGIGQQLQVAHNWADDPLPSDRPRLVRFGLIEGGTEHLLVMAASQMVMDPWSWGVLLRDLCQAYEAAEQPISNEPDYGDYARWQRKHLNGARYARHLEFWRTRCAGYPSAGLSLPNAIRDASPAGPAATTPVAVAASPVQGLRSLSRALRVSLFHLMLGLFQGAVCQWSGTSDVLVGSATANRTLSGTENMVGFFVNGRFTRTQVPKRASVADIVTQVRNGWVDADAHQELHLEPTLFDLGVPDLVNVKFSINDIPTLRSLPSLAGHVLRRVPLGVRGSSSARRHISLALSPDQGALRGALTYRTDLLSESAARELLCCFDDLLRRALAGPQTPIVI